MLGVVSGCLKLPFETLAHGISMTTLKQSVAFWYLTTPKYYVPMDILIQLKNDNQSECLLATATSITMQSVFCKNEEVASFPVGVMLIQKPFF